MSVSPFLPHSFQFSQASLQDYVDCPRRFQLRHVLMQPWPALITNSPAEAEQHMQRGADLHRLLHQHALGLDATTLERSINDPVLAQWWRTYLEHPPPDLPIALRSAEISLSAPLGDHRLAARLDLLAVQPGRQVVIVDWKTPLRRPSRASLAQRLQTRVYCYVTVEAGASLSAGVAIRPEQVEILFWYATFGGETERFRYDREQHAQNRTYLLGLASEIARERASIWTRTSDERRCRFCNYRSLCERSVRPGFLQELDEDLEPASMEIDLEQIAEIAF